jgi:hypothetical protein
MADPAHPQVLEEGEEALVVLELKALLELAYHLLSLELPSQEVSVVLQQVEYCLDLHMDMQPQQQLLH